MSNESIGLADALPLNLDPSCMNFVYIVNNDATKCVEFIYDLRFKNARISYSHSSGYFLVFDNEFIIYE